MTTTPDEGKSEPPAGTSDPPPSRRSSASMLAAPQQVGLVRGLVRTIRPHQWVKNLFVLAPIVFAKDAFQKERLIPALGAVAIFCLLSGAVYTLNDIIDVEADRVHPVKRRRPIASGSVPVPIARAFLGGLLVVAFALALLAFRLRFAAVAGAYFTINVAYSLRLKKIHYLDVGCIAAGFVLRVLGGGYAIAVRPSWYMFACTALLALFLGFGKRRHEIAQEHAGKQRKALEAYTAKGLDVALTLTGGATVLTYIAYTLDPSTRAFFKTDQLWMTSPSVVMGVARFVQIVKGHPKAESPTQEMLRDSLFVLNLVLWAIVVLVIVYRLRPNFE